MNTSKQLHINYMQTSVDPQQFLNDHYGTISTSSNFQDTTYKLSNRLLELLYQVIKPYQTLSNLIEILHKLFVHNIINLKKACIYY